MSVVPLVSALITVYNREKYLRATLDSILESSVQDFEIVIVDDDSNDCSLRIAEEYAKKDTRFKVLRNEKNLGDYPNRMKAASLARGRYLKYVDSDDLIYPHTLGVMVDAMERNPVAALGLAHSMPEDESPYPWCLTPEQAYRKHFLGRGCLSCGPSSAIIRRDAFEAVGGFDPKWGVIADSELWYRLAARWPTVLLPPGLIWWRRHSGQEFTKADAEVAYLKGRYALSTMALGATNCPLNSNDRHAALQRARQHFSRRLLSLGLRKLQLRAALRLFRDSDLRTGDLLKGLHGYR